MRGKNDDLKIRLALDGPGATHAFNVPFEKPMDYLGHHFEHDEKATQEAQKDADAFMDAHMK